ncbi:MAG: NCS2 family nucleobase:cation symporter [Coriobacteriia bacterium]|nr:NCS2 family nucleobase:cation symporter [Coriobacteriia bacterium]
MAIWKLHGDGKSKPGEVIAPDERLTWPRTVGIGLQHIIAMFGATFLVPLITGFPPTTTLFFSAIATITFLLITRNKVPSYLGSSFAFISPVIAASSGSMGAALFGIVCAGVLLAIVGLIVMAVGSGWINKLMPPVVTGVIVALIGFNLAPVAYGSVMAQPVLAVITFSTIILIQALSKGMIGRLSIIIGVLVGYASAAVMGLIDFTPVAEAAWIGLPTFHLPEVNFGVLLMFLPVVLVLVAENIGHVKSVATMTGKNLDKYIGRTLFSDGIGTTLAGLGGGSGTTTYAENIGVMAATRVYSTAAYWVAAFGALLLSLCPKFGEAIFLLPQGVLGGVTIILYGMIGMLGVRIWVENRVDFANNVNMLTGAVPLVMGIVGFTLFAGASGMNIGESLTAGDIEIGPIAVASIMALVVYHLMIGLNKLRGIELPKPVEYREIKAGQDATALDED